MITDVAELVGQFEPNTPEWHQLRAEGLGGSDVAAVMGLSPWTSRFTLWHRKAGLLPPDAVQLTPAMEWGNRLEAVVADKFADNHPEYVVADTGTWRRTDRPWQIANPDRLLHNSDGHVHELLEIKTANGLDVWKWGDHGSDNIPVYYRCQVVWYMDVLNIPVAWLAVLIGGNDYREYRIEYNAAEAALIREEAQEFIASLNDASRRPDIDDSYSTYDTVRELHPDIDGDQIDIPEELATTYLAACTEERAIKKLKQQAASRVLDTMGTARYAAWNGQRIAMRATKGDSKPFLRAVTLRERKTAA